MADALCWLLASRQQILDLLELEQKGASNPALAETLPGTLAFLTDLCQVQAARAGGEVSRICAELAFGYNRHPRWDAEGCQACFNESELEGLENYVPGIESVAYGYSDVVDNDGSHPLKRGPCALMGGLEPFISLRSKLDGCMTGCRLAKDRAAQALTRVMIPEALDYPQ